MEKKKYQLPKEFATKWVADLRSGIYQQSKGALQNDAGYCCLGVACCTVGNSADLFGKPYPTTALLPINEFWKYADDSNYTFMAELAKMNDAGNSFNEIADWIEENVEFV